MLFLDCAGVFLKIFKTDLRTSNSFNGFNKKSKKSFLITSYAISLKLDMAISKGKQ